MNLIEIMKQLYNSEINVGIYCFWDGGFNVMLGDADNGFRAVANFDGNTLEDAAPWLDAQARKHFPDSDYAKSKL